jgi:acyl-CoA thioesterase-2
MGHAMGVDLGIIGGDLTGWGDHAPNLLQLDPVGADRFRGRFNQANFQKVLYGGQLLAQAVMAADKTDSQGDLQSLHAYFLRGGDGAVPVDFAVQRLRDSGNSSSRRVSGLQGGGAMFELTCLFRHPHEGRAHQASPIDNATPPEELRSLVEIHREDPSILGAYGDFLLVSAPIEMRPFSLDHLRFTPGPARRSCWLRLPSGGEVDDLMARRALLAYLSDFWFARAVLIPHTTPAPDPDMLFASIDHSMWFYGDPKLDDWILYEADSPISSGDTALAQGRMFDREGRLLAVTTQQVVLRQRRT